MKKFMIKTKTPVIFSNKDCGRLINHYRFIASTEKGAINQYLNSLRHDREYLEYCREYKEV